MNNSIVQTLERSQQLTMLLSTHNFFYGQRRILWQDRHSHQNFVHHPLPGLKDILRSKRCVKTRGSKMAAFRHFQRPASTIRSNMNRRIPKLFWPLTVLHGYRSKSVVPFIIAKRRHTNQMRSTRRRICARGIRSPRALSRTQKLRSKEHIGRERRLFASQDDEAPDLELRTGHQRTRRLKDTLDVDNGISRKMVKEPPPDWLMPWLLASSLLLMFLGGGMLIICLICSSFD